MIPRHTVLLVLAAAMPLAGCSTIQKKTRTSPTQTANKPEREEWFINQALGMFVHWSVDSQLGSVISHSMVGASDDYLDRFIGELPRSFNPEKFDPELVVDLKGEIAYLDECIQAGRLAD